ncbi:MAG: L-aspartate oxidase [Planctomycetia bacterium]|nr:L-aspartate oxidase [Planctomycetia bacterium]
MSSQRSIASPRYLVPFHAKQHPHFFTDILIIGGGLAGLRAALAVDPSLSVLVICKAGLSNSNSVKAQGGIATVWDFKTDTFESHVADTLVAGGELCDKETVDYIVRHGTEEVQKLIEIGTIFDKKEDGSLLLGREGGHTQFRIIHALGDATGQEIMRAVINEAKLRPNIRIWEDTFVLDLLTADGFCRGAVVHWNKENETELIWAKQTILASGGIGQLYRETTNPEVACGDGVAMAYRAGAVIRDMEFVQFHPTVLYIAGGSRSLITEAMRGEGAYLIDKNGDRFMSDYDSRGELAPRDVVSRSIVKQMIKTNHPNVYLDLTHKNADWIYKRFPGIAAVCAQFGLDLAKDRIPVRPGAHYSMGGVLIDHFGRTTIKGLWAAGEVSSCGLHGANRLASNSLLEALVFGEQTGRLASEIAVQMSDEYRALPIENKPMKSALEPCRKCKFPIGCDNSESSPQKSKVANTILVDIMDIRNSLKSMMWRLVGVVRDENGLKEALNNIDQWSSYVFSHQFHSTEAWELQNMLTVSRMIIEGALERQETRGSHNRSDFTDFDPDIPAKHSIFRYVESETVR